jgi:hypothetical protein
MLESQLLHRRKYLVDLTAFLLKDIYSDVLKAKKRYSVTNSTWKGILARTKGLFRLFHCFLSAHFHHAIKRMISKSKLNSLYSAAIAALLTTSALSAGGNLSNCKGGCPGGESCVGNPFSQPVSDSECSACGRGQYWWPCNFEVRTFTAQ